ncbi:hypothetical protein RB195_008628 [Necator americanus]|uniref:Uncharacterized protein n=1 Tax=Necator americanus TaxID=51031 RepID=A0ABR1CPK9_NECAM
MTTAVEIAVGIEMGPSRTAAVNGGSKGPHSILTATLYRTALSAVAYATAPSGASCARAVILAGSNHVPGVYEGFVQ